MLAELERILAKKDPSERYATSADLRVDLRGLHRDLAHMVLRPAWVPMRLAAMPLRKLRRWVLAAAVGALLVVGLGALPQVRQRLPWFRPAIAGPKRLVVLPFQALGGAPENQAYSDGITDTLTAKLTQLTATHQL